ncbi:MAG: HEAT repeat domain-containing protein [Myxococcota bacterium]
MYWALTASLVGCVSSWIAPPLHRELTEADADAARALGSNLVSGRFPSEVAQDCDRNATAFTWLAARSTDPAVVRAALIAAAGCDAQVDPEDLGLAAAAHVDSPDPRTLMAALGAADAILGDLPVEHPLVGRLVVRGFDRHPQVRYEVLQVLDRRAWSQEAPLAAPFVAALHETDAPWLVTEVLRRVRYRAKGLADPNPFRASCVLLTTDLDPGIRGRAALVLARLAPEDPQIVTILRYMLRDPHGYSRSAAAEALTEIGYVPAIHDLAARLDDPPAKNTWDMLPFDRLDGTSEAPHHAGSLHDKDHDAYLRAIQALSAGMGDDAFVYREVSALYSDLDIISAKRDAKKWYAAHADQIPKPE